MLKPSNSVFPTQRMEVISLVFEKIDPADRDMDSDSDEWDPYPDDHPSDIKGSCRILIADVFKVHEIYNPEKLINFTVLPTQMQPSDDAGFQNISKRRRVDVDSTSGHIDLPLTGPILDIKPICRFFTFIVHQDTCNEKLLKENINRYLEGQAANPGVKSYVSVVTDLSFDTPLNFEFRDDFFSLTLDCIVFRDSKLVTVSVKWLMDDNIGGDAKKTQATKTTHICGKLYFHSSAFDTTSVLLETPEDKVIEVEHDKPIPLLRSVVAVPYMSSFEVEASLLDPINNFDVKGSTISFVQSEENILQTFSHCFCGNGAQIKVEITMKPNDLVRESWVRHK